MPILATPKPGPDVLLIENGAGLSFQDLKGCLQAAFTNAIVISNRLASCEPIFKKIEANPKASCVFVVGKKFDASKIHELRETLKLKNIGIGGLIIKKGAQAGSLAEERIYENTEMPHFHFGFQGSTIRRPYMLAVMYTGQEGPPVPTDLKENIFRAAHLAHMREMSNLATGIK